ncbi:MAG: hypothetical protein ABIS50_22730 [Luteolibacter sp.]|uniref:hypothetical protein n=1 Tax=Luteolibacter sp. TaxID=1962973 RepID=UPI003266054B
MKAIPLLLLSLLSVRSEVEYQLDPDHDSSFTIRVVDGQLVCGSDVIRPRVPIVVTVTNEQNEPVKGAIAAIKRIEPDGYTEEDVKNTKNSSTDEAGHITLYCSCGIDNSASDKPKLQIIGAITVVADGYETKAIELEQYYAGMEVRPDDRAALAAHLVLKKKVPKDQ